jgi:hypothetical protein
MKNSTQQHPPPVALLAVASVRMAMIDRGLWSRIEAINLEPIQIKLMFPRSGVGLTQSEAFALAGKYRKFLYLCGKNPGQTIVPTHEIDIMWHTHILDTQNYALDCHNAFGYFLHHFPYMGLRGVQDETERKAAFSLTAEMFNEVFGELYGAVNDEGSLCISTASGCGGNGVSRFARPTFASLSTN